MTPSAPGCGAGALSINGPKSLADDLGLELLLGQTAGEADDGCQATPSPPSPQKAGGEHRESWRTSLSLPPVCLPPSSLILPLRGARGVSHAGPLAVSPLAARCGPSLHGGPSPVGDSPESLQGMAASPGEPPSPSAGGGRGQSPPSVWISGMRREAWERRGPGGAASPWGQDSVSRAGVDSPGKPQRDKQHSPPRFCRRFIWQP